MRALFTKAVAGSMIAGAALMVSACGGKTSDNATDNTMVTDMNATEGMDTMTDNMTSTDGSGNGGMMANDSTAGNSAMMSNDTMMSNSTGNTM